jgi:predicted acyl esterase
VLLNASSLAAATVEPTHAADVNGRFVWFPKYDRNLNTGGDNEQETHYVVARQRILHDATHRSLVRLPIIPR